MKRNVLIIAGVLVAATLALANGQFEKAMSKNIAAMYTEKSPETLQAVINQLNRIGEAEGDRWEPYYYAAFGYIRMSGMFEKGEDKDKYLDLAMTAVDQAASVAPENSEVEAMRGYVNMIKLTVDPAQRGMTYSGLAFSSFQKAIQLDPENPRAHFLMGRMQHGTAQFMGGGFEQACASLNQAKMLFQKESEQKNSVAPGWGRQGTEEAIQQICSDGE